MVFYAGGSSEGPLAVMSNATRSIESAIATPFISRLQVWHNELTREFKVSTKTVGIHFSYEKRKEDKKVTVHGAKDVYLFSSMGIHIKGGKSTEFLLDFESGITTHLRRWESRVIYFEYGDALFCIDQRSRQVKVWSPAFWFDFSRGFIGICMPEPRPELSL